MKFLAIVAIGALALSCGTKKNANTEEVKSDDSEPSMKITAEIGKLDESSTSDAFTINSMNVVGNTLFMEVSYSGGCKDHTFEVVGSPMVAKSMPPIRSVQIKHTANGDNCRANVMKVLEIDISKLAYQQTAGSEIYLTFEGWKERVKYTYE